MPESITVKIPATTANLGPGFDCLALALDMWNVTTFTLGGQSIQLQIKGEGDDSLPSDERNLLVRTVLHIYRFCKVTPPAGLHILCENHIPLGSGLGSSASAVLAGLLGANALLGNPLNNDEILNMGYELEGHPDNISAALLGGLVIMTTRGRFLITRRVEIAPIQVVVVVPRFNFPTRAARTALPKTVPFKDAVFNLGRTALVVEALRSGDLDLLAQVLEDRLHQPYRLKLIPGSEAALEAARRAGAVAAGLSGAGPGLIAFPGSITSEKVASIMVNELEKAGLTARSYYLAATPKGGMVEID
jgi:homoserine kinase